MDYTDKTFDELQAYFEGIWRRHYLLLDDVDRERFKKPAEQAFLRACAHVEERSSLVDDVIYTSQLETLRLLREELHTRFQDEDNAEVAEELLHQLIWSSLRPSIVLAGSALGAFMAEQRGGSIPEDTQNIMIQACIQVLNDTRANQVA
ncbi:hypothetical protein GC177_05850 [bacterium]|nr:hypothetical protein [bacterium]